MSGGWKGSDRRDGLPSWWPVTVRRILRRDPTCRCEGCPRCWPTPRSECLRPSRECDHLGDPADHRDLNLAGKCRPCHGLKSSRQGNQAKAVTPTRFGQPIEKHPGQLY